MADVYISPSLQEWNVGYGNYGTEEQRMNLIADVLDYELKRHGLTTDRNSPDMTLAHEFLGLLLFVGVPLPGTGAWTGSLIASLLEVDIKKSSIAILCGLIMATVIMYVVSYGIVGNLIH